MMSHMNTKTLNQPNREMITGRDANRILMHQHHTKTHLSHLQRHQIQKIRKLKRK